MANQFTSPTGETRAIRVARIASERVGQNRTGSGIVKRALTAIDLERVSSAPGVIRAFAGIVEQVQADRELSDHGKRARIEAAATSRLGNLASVARDVAGLEREHSAAKAEAVKLEKADAADMLLDLRLAEYVREREPIPTVLVQMSERIRVAVARLPAELSGITPEVQARVVGSLVSPQAAVRFEEEAEALSAARAVVQAGIDELAPLAGWQPAELVQHFGADWKLPGVVAPFADRMVAAQAGAEAA